MNGCSEMWILTLPLVSTLPFEPATRMALLILLRLLVWTPEAIAWTASMSTSSILLIVNVGEREMKDEEGEEEKEGKEEKRKEEERVYLKEKGKGKNRVKKKKKKVNTFFEFFLSFLLF